MARKPKDPRTPDQRTEDLLRCRSRTEVFRRLRGYCQHHLAARVAAGAPVREIAHIEQDIAQITEMLALDGTYPIDTPPASPAVVRPEQPLVPPGAEDWLPNFIADLAGDPA